jgi:hypothetical protein
VRRSIIRWRLRLRSREVEVKVEVKVKVEVERSPGGSRGGFAARRVPTG